MRSDSWILLCSDLTVEKLTDGTYGVFNHDYSDAYLLNEADLLLLDVLRETQAPTSESELFSFASTRLDDIDIPHLREYFDKALEQMRFAGMIDRAREN